MNEQLGFTGSGGYVMKAKHKLSGKTFAVKRIQNSPNRREIEILEQTNHPNILELHEVFEEAQYIHLVTELCRGGDLEVFIEEVEFLTEELSSILMRQLL